MACAAEKIWTIRETLSWAEEYLAGYEVPDAKTEAEYILSHVLNCKRAGLHIDFNRTIDPYELQRFAGFVERRIKREPSQYIIGEQEFWGLPFKVTRDVLIPRPETELLVEETVRIVRGQPTILDLCTGSGCIAISLAKEIPGCKVYAIDISERALEVAMENAERHDVAGRITFLQGDMFKPLNGLNIKAD
ncbi:MAG: HemK/PrmC family methyltransferase, partial [Deltaproteobacteria bacterium]